MSDNIRHFPNKDEDSTIEKWPMTGTKDAANMARLEMALIRAGQGFERWATEATHLVCEDRLTYQETLVLHCIRLLGTSTTLSELLTFLNRKDVSNIQYCLRKLIKADLVERAVIKTKRETGYTVSEKGKELSDAFSKIRQEILIELVTKMNGFEEDLEVTCNTLERLTGTYDQATQTVLNKKFLVY